MVGRDGEWIPEFVTRLWQQRRQGQLRMILYRVLEKPKQLGQRSALGSVYVFWKGKDEKVCKGLRGRGLEQKRQYFKGLFVGGRTGKAIKIVYAWEKKNKLLKCKTGH